MERFKLGTEVSNLIKEIDKGLRTNMEKAFEDVDLTIPQINVINVIRKGKKVRISEISREVKLSNSTVSGIVDRLEKAGYVVRKRSEQDKRVVFVELTIRFKRKSKEFQGALEKYLNNLMSNAKESEIEEIVNGLRKLKEVISRANRK
ncbi:DNA-binding transcriptional regulator, MarR family [Clostridium cavendishii DSM 21758]|uniref:DNA-binding transcriptional regulator, MarR family n=1 Tax=Clostridium cavendishii DSM 21758 TaxID=1121302 RepID=A0A1M6D9W8_9CLOT|nr:MarR family transcriptional regulator [Clostridium cavendishii]SHI70016.1 DNA-binding transcriptional regulator, MarR family [Clostridium cavendishii DSM 21758]